MIAGALFKPEGIQESINHAHTAAVSGCLLSSSCINKTPPRKAVTGSWYLGATRIEAQRTPMEQWRLSQLFLDTCRTTAALAQVVKLGLTHITTTFDFNRVNQRAVGLEGTLNANAV